MLSIVADFHAGFRPLPKPMLQQRIVVTLGQRLRQQHHDINSLHQRGRRCRPDADLISERTARRRDVISRPTYCSLPQQTQQQQQQPG